MHMIEMKQMEAREETDRNGAVAMEIENSYLLILIPTQLSHYLTSILLFDNILLFLKNLIFNRNNISYTSSSSFTENEFITN